MGTAVGRLAKMKQKEAPALPPSSSQPPAPQCPSGGNGGSCATLGRWELQGSHGASCDNISLHLPEPGWNSLPPWALLQVPGLGGEARDRKGNGSSSESRRHSELKRTTRRAAGTSKGLSLARKSTGLGRGGGDGRTWLSSLALPPATSGLCSKLGKAEPVPLSFIHSSPKHSSHRSSGQCLLPLAGWDTQTGTGPSKVLSAPTAEAPGSGHPHRPGPRVWAGTSLESLAKILCPCITQLLPGEA